MNLCTGTMYLFSRLAVAYSVYMQSYGATVEMLGVQMKHSIMCPYYATQCLIFNGKNDYF